MDVKNKFLQGGAALFSSLIVLLVVSVIALNAARSSSMEMLIATNQQNSIQALANGEDSALFGERFIALNHALGGPTIDFSIDNTDGLYLANTVDPETTNWGAFSVEEVVDLNGIVVNRFVVEYLSTHSVGNLAIGAGGGAQIRHLYRVTGLGVGPKGTTRLVQTVFATR